MVTCAYLRSIEVLGTLASQISRSTSLLTRISGSPCAVVAKIQLFAFRICNRKKSYVELELERMCT